LIKFKSTIILKIIIPLLILISCAKKDELSNIDYKNLGLHIQPVPGNGSQALIDSIANTLDSQSTMEKLSNIWFWIQYNFKFDSKVAEKPKNFEVLFRSGLYGDSRTHSILFGSLCRALKIPTIWVNAVMDTWLLDRSSDPDNIPPVQQISLLECFIDGDWRLIDSYGGAIFNNYNKNKRNLPKFRYIFEKTTDINNSMYAIHWQRWGAHLNSVFSEFTQAKLENIEDEGNDFLLDKFKGRRPSIGVKIKKSGDGVLVMEVKRKFPADIAGVLPADIITHLNNEKLTDVFHLVDLVVHRGFGAKFSLSVIRDGKKMIIPVKVPEQGE